MKALILTRVETTAEVKALVNNSNIVKIAVNHADYIADYRIFNDWGYWRSFLCYPEKMYTNSIAKLPEKYKDRFSLFTLSNRPNTKDKNKLYMQSSSLTLAIDFAIKLGAKDILLIADGDVGTSGFLPQLFIPQMNIAFKKLRKHANIYMFQKGFYDLPVMSIKEFYEL